MKIYLDPISTTCRPILLFLAETRLTAEIEIVSLFEGAHLAPDFAAINPNRAVPALRDGDFVLTEASAILKHLADLVTADSYPCDLKARARVNEVMDWFNTGFNRDFGYGLVYPQTLPNYPFANPVTQADVIRRAAERSARWLSILDDHWLARGPFVCGETPTIADFLGAAYVSVGDWIGFDLSPYPNVVLWLERMRARPSWAATHGAFDALTAMLRQPQLKTA